MNQIANNTERYYSKEFTLVQLFEKTVKEAPDAIALKEGYKTLSYRELNSKVNKMSRYMIASGVKPGDQIAILLNRSIEMVIAILSVLKAGGSYLPLSTQSPDERNRSILKDSHTRFVVMKSQKEQIILPNIIILTTEETSWAQEDNSNLNIHISSSSLAYIIFTSGSTGNPKGSAIRHFSVVNRLLWMINEYSLNEKDVFLQKTICTFDVSVWEIFIGLIIGAKTYLLREGEEKNIAIISKTIIEEKITVCHFVPSMFKIFLEYVKHKNIINNMQYLRHIFSSGEILDYNSVQKFNDLFAKQYKTQLHNLYGPTETTIDVSYFNCTNYRNPLKIVPIGKPIWNTKIYILNEDLSMCNDNEPGEIYVSGDGVALGYLNRDDITEKNFIQDIYWQEHIMYKTGDIGVWSNGNILYLGRKDNQIKINGYRIELEEIEYFINHVEGIRNSLVTLVKINNCNLLEAYYTSEFPINAKTVKSYLKSKLPLYMIPTNFYRLDSFLYTPSGKVDRKRISECNIIG